MRPIHLLLLMLIFLAQSAFAYEKSRSGPCSDIAKACMNAGYTRDDDGDKKFWKDCMKPIIFGMKVSGVDISPETAKSCRTDKIKEFKKKLQEFQSGHPDSE
jgi:hypothetical protein